MSLGQARLLVNDPRRSSETTVMTVSRPAPPTAPTLRLRFPRMGTRANRWLIKTRKVRTHRSSLPLLTLAPTWLPPSSMVPYKTPAHSGEEDHHMPAQMGISLGTKARSLTISPRTSTKRCLSRTQTSKPLPSVHTRRAMRNSLSGHLVPGSSKTSLLLKHHPRAMVHRRASLTEAQCRHTRLSSNSSNNNKTILSDSYPARIWVVLPVR